MEGNIDANDFHGRTSWPARNDRSLHPISRVKEARGLNQPIGIMETEDRLLANLEGLDAMQSSVPKYSCSYELYALHCRANNT